MKFDCEYEGIQITITIEKDEATPMSHINQFSSEDVEDLKIGQLFFYSIYIESSQGGQTVKHYLPNQLLTSDETELPADLDDLMEDEDIFQKIVEKWELVKNQDSPPFWAK